MNEIKPIKATFKPTGETVYVTPTNDFVKCHIPTYQTSDGREFIATTLEFKKEIDWEQRKWELVKEIFVKRLTLPEERLSLTPEGDAIIAIDLADEFIETYKNK